jgi:hypothetical protein
MGFSRPPSSTKEDHGDRISDLETMLWSAMHGRCAACNWPLAVDKEHGCVPGDCSFRPGEHDPQHTVWLRRAKLMREINLAAARPRESAEVVEK